MAGKRELISPKGDKRYIRRDEKGRISESEELGRSLAADRRVKAKTVAKKGQGDKGIQRCFDARHLSGPIGNMLARN
jgi:hypothetical protein